jgi:hypothetical protein
MTYNCCEQLGSRLKLDETELLPEVTLKITLEHLNAFRYLSRFVDQVQRLIIHNEAELNKGHKINRLSFLYYLGVRTMVAIMSLICKKCNLFGRFLDGGCCCRVCIRQIDINQREVKSSDESVTDRGLDQQTRSHTLRPLPSASSLEMTLLNPVPFGIRKQRGVRLNKRWW